MQVVGQCPEDMRKAADIEVLAIEPARKVHQISTPSPSENGGEENKADKTDEQQRKEQDVLIETLFREQLARGRDRSSFARAKPH